MRLTIERAALLKALGHVQSVVERRNTIPILSNVLLAADKDTVTFSATDLDMEIIDEGTAQVDGPGQITAPAHTLYEIVRKLPEGADVELRFTGEDPRLSISAGRSRFNLPVLPAGDFPVMSSDGLSGGMDVAGKDRIRRMDRTGSPTPPGGPGYNRNAPCVPRGAGAGRARGPRRRQRGGALALA